MNIAQRGYSALNDFTKEELEELVMWSSHLAGCNPSLLKKIQSMIENFGKSKCPIDRNNKPGWIWD